MSSVHSITVSFPDPESIKVRADRYLADNQTQLSRTQIASQTVSLKINGKESKLSAMVKQGDQLIWEYAVPEKPQLKGEDLHLDILYEDDHTLIVNKPAGMVVHPAVGNRAGTLVHGLIGYLDWDISGEEEGENDRPGIVHRLDKETSGILIAAKNQQAVEFYSRQFKDRLVEKKYVAVIKGVKAPPTGQIEGAIGRCRSDRKKMAVVPDGKPAITNYSVIASNGRYSYLLLSPKTGRTHQLRVHLSHTGNPIVGDPVYSRNKGEFKDTGLLLHAYSLEITLFGAQKKSLFKAPLEDRFYRFFESIGEASWGEFDYKG